MSHELKSTSTPQFKPPNFNLWETPPNYGGEDYFDYYIIAARHRDSGRAEEKKFARYCRFCGIKDPDDGHDYEKPDKVIIARARHWAVGWVEVLLVHKDESLLLIKLNDKRNVDILAENL
jgi:hypothetical protein